MLNLNAGVYCIMVNIDGGGFYVGSSSDLCGRIRHHYGELRRGEHHSRKMQKAWNAYGIEVFSSMILAFSCDKGERLALEQAWMDRLEAYGPNGMNTEPNAGISTGVKRTEAVKLALCGKTPSSETREKMRAAKLGRSLTPEHRLKIGIALAAHTRTPEHAAKLAVTWVGRTHSEATRVQMSLDRKGRRPASKATASEEGKLSLDVPPPD